MGGRLLSKYTVKLMVSPILAVPSHGPGALSATNAEPVEISGGSAKTGDIPDAKTRIRIKVFIAQAILLIAAPYLFQPGLLFDVYVGRPGHSADEMINPTVYRLPACRNLDIFCITGSGAPAIDRLRNNSQSE